MSGELRFTYASSGEVERCVYEWAEGPAYIRGYCIVAGAVRTFRKDRVTAWLYGTEHSLKSSTAPKARRKPSRPAGREILFTGFAAAERQAMEENATSSGWIVRRTVSKGLTCLICGPNAGPSKVRRALDQGTLVLGPEEMTEALLRDGEIA